MRVLETLLVTSVWPLVNLLILWIPNPLLHNLYLALLVIQLGQEFHIPISMTTIVILL